MTPRSITFYVNVVSTGSGNIGSSPFYANGKLQLVCVKCPRVGAGIGDPYADWEPDPIDENCTYWYDLKDEAKFGIGGYDKMRGDQTNMENKIMGERECTFTILNASQVGVYLVRLYWESQP